MTGALAVPGVLVLDEEVSVSFAAEASFLSPAGAVVPLETPSVSCVCVCVFQSSLR